MKTTNTNLFSRFKEIRKEMEVITNHNYPAIGGVTVDFYFDNSAEECWLYVDVADTSSASSDTYLAIVPKRFATLAENIEFDRYSDAGYAKQVICLAESALSAADCHQMDNQKMLRAGGYDLRLS